MLGNLKRGIAAAIFISLAGCVPSVHPLYTDEDCIFKPELVGVWQKEDARDTWAFAKRDEESYDLVYTDENGLKGNFIAHLVELQGVTFLDLFPGEAEPEIKVNGLYMLHFVPCHFFARVGEIGPTLQLAFTDAEWTKDFLVANPGALKHEIFKTGDDEERLLVTAPTAELQKFWAEHARTVGAFTDPLELKRQAQPAAPKDAPE